ncbi:uncharacterized protein si:zfos-1056e6.1 [Clupea harengus]|uniref:Uncharacterized protein si:zfos-1056e6.1 n=1 Tax=Clupea harengus TaxID=7950 RepID=A0A8M1KET1_CLUHA|nr:uncharacterized protein si:zfos-1056e6.1 [Clupea harengus]
MLKRAKCVLLLTIYAFRSWNYFQATTFTYNFIKTEIVEVKAGLPQRRSSLTSHILLVNEMAKTNCDKPHTQVWIALKRLDQNDERVIALREVRITRDAEVATIKQLISHSFGLASQVTLKIRNSQGSLIPLNSALPANTKQRPHVLEVAKTFQHVTPKPRLVAMTVIHKSLKSRLQSAVRRIERLEELLPQIKLQHHEEMNKDIELLNQKLIFLHKRMKMADSRCWKGSIVKPPLW